MALGARIPRPRVGDLIAQNADRRVRLIGAPQGYGKSSALRDYAESIVGVYVGLPKDATFARFASGLVEAVSRSVPGLKLTFAGAYGRALQTTDPPAALATWFLRHLAAVPYTIILDDLQHAVDSRVNKFIVAAIEQSPPTCKWIVASESFEELPVSSWLTRRLTAYPFHPFKLCLTLEEALEFARRFSPQTDHSTVELLLEATAGIPAEFLFALRAPADLISEDAFSDRLQPLAARIFESLSEGERNLLLRSAALSEPTEETLIHLLGDEEARGLRRIRDEQPYLFEPVGLGYQPCFAEFLRSRVASLSQRDDILGAAARALEAAGDLVGVLGILATLGRDHEILAIVERHGFPALERHHAVLFQDALARLGEESLSKSPVALTLLAMAAALSNRHDVSEAYFKSALQACRDEAQRRGVRFWYACDLLRQSRLEAIELLRWDDESPGVSTFIRIASKSALAAAYAIGEDNQTARRTISSALDEIRESHDEALKARVYHQAAFVALCDCRYDEAKELAGQSLALAERTGSYETAGGALSVLHNVAYSVDERLDEAIGYLRRIAECGARCGSSEKQLYALGNAYEIEAERGDERGAAKLEEQLAAFDASYGTVAADEAILPAQVLQLTWHGEFSRAYQILKGSGDQQPDAGRRALRWSEIALYAAAAGILSDASAALEKARKHLRSTPSSDAQGWRTQANLGLTLLLLGRKRAAYAAVASAEKTIEAVPRRIGALIDLVAALTRAGRTDQLAVFHRLERLYDCGFGGYARMIEALPRDLFGIVPEHRAKADAA